MILGQRAVVIGGSIAGLCAAGALSDHFREVVVLERDELSEQDEHRRGAPQSRHPHFLLNSGREAIEGLYPGFEKRLLTAGALELDPSRDTAYCESRGWAPRKQGVMTMLYASRVLLERVLRTLALEIPNVEIRTGVRATGLDIDRGDGRAVTGVRLTSGDQPNGDRSLEADLVVDAGGRGSPCSGWIEEAGFGAVPVRTLNARVTYSSRWYDGPPESERPEPWWWEHLAVIPDSRPDAPAEHQYLSTIFPVEAGKWIVLMGSWGLEMPKTATDFEQRARNVRTPLFSSALDRAKPLSDVFVTRSTANVWRRFDAASSPARFVALGDAVCAFNPLYGQGMSAAAVSATILKRFLMESADADTEFVRAFFREQAKFLRIPWSLAVLRDSSYAHSTGTESLPRGIRKSLLRRTTWPVFNLLSGAAREDSVVERNFSRVYNIQQPLATMLRSPRVLAGVAWYQLKRWTRTTRLPEYAEPHENPPAEDHSHGTA